MKILKNPFFIFFGFMACCIYLAPKMALPLPKWIAFYANDFLCMPLVLSISLAAIRYIKKNAAIYVPLRVVLAITTYYAVYFEWIMPKFSSRYTSDPIDILLYFLGAILFVVVQKRLY